VKSVHLVGIGLPVFNGEKHLAFALDSILAQTHSNFELIISDNASTDRTEEICRDYAGRDHRIRYFRNSENLGASKNYNRVFELFSGGKYFRWAAHDDVIAPTNLEKCVAALEACPAASLAFPRRRYITWEEGRVIGNAWESVAGASTEDGLVPGRPTNRLDSFDNINFAAVLRLYGGWLPVFAFALMPTELLRKTQLLQPFPAADRILIAELAMLGQFVEVPEELYFQRLHPASNWTLRNTPEQEAAWFSPTRRAPKYPKMNIYIECLKAICRSPIAPHKKLAHYLDFLNRLIEAGANGVRRKFGLPPGGQLHGYGRKVGGTSAAACPPASAKWQP
jgi:glycosyltransferase involved in cell wall biosynthesis